MFSEKGEEAMKQGMYAQAKEFFAQALKLNPDFIHLHTIVAGIDRTVQVHGAAQKIAEAQVAMKAFKFKYANQLLREAVLLNPEKVSSVAPILESLVPLMKSEEAIVRHRAGQLAMEEKRYTDALSMFSEAIALLPESSAEMASFLSDRALAHYELKDFSAAVSNCEAALALQPDLANAFYRLGMAQFGLDMYDEASVSYEKALKCDPSLSEQVKVKTRQVFTAREVQQRKERETERMRQKEAEKKILEEKRLRDEAIKKEKAEKLAAEKAERMRQKDEEKSLKASREKELQEEKDRDKEAEKERLRLEKAEKEALKASEKYVSPSCAWRTY